MAWAKSRPEAFSDKTGKPDTRGAYGLLAREVIGLLKHLQHAEGKTVIFVGILERVTDDMGRTTWQPQMEGGKAARELPGIVDQVMTLSLFSRDGDGWRHDPDRGEHRRLVCRAGNPFAPARQGPQRPPRRDRAAGPRRAPLQDQRHHERMIPMTFDMNDAEPQKTGDLIPDGTFAKVTMTIRPGGIDGESEIDRGLLKRSGAPGSDVLMLDCEFTVAEGPHARRKFWQTLTTVRAASSTRAASRSARRSPRARCAP